MTIEAALVGAGQRGHHVYGRYALDHADRLRFTAVVDPDPARRARFGDAHSLAEVARYETIEQLLADRVPVAAVVASPDRAHADDALQLVDADVAVLVEKPMASSPDAAARLAAASDRGMLQVAHVLRSTVFFDAVHEIVTSGRLGDIVTALHTENVVAWHMAHSFVRGNWGRSAEATPMIVQKCCHDLDVLAWNLPEPVERVSSFGALRHFRPEHAPEGATARCTDGCEVVCPFDARTVYLDEARTGWPVHVITDDLSTEGRLEALRDGPYGRCVYQAGSDVVDHQVVAMEVGGGRSATLVMHGHSPREERTVAYHGTAASLTGVFGATSRLEVTDHRTGRVEPVSVDAPAGGHGGGDVGAIESFVSAVASGGPVSTSARDVLEGHLLAFAAEEARRSGEVIDMARYRRAHLPS